MKNIVNHAFSRPSAVILVLFTLLLTGLASIKAIPKEQNPEINLPQFFISLAHYGISPEDAESLIIKPMEKALLQVEGVKEITSTAAEGFAGILVELTSGTDLDQGLIDIREKVDGAKADLPEDTLEPVITEYGTALMPIARLALGGNVSERGLYQIATRLEDLIETAPGVLKVDVWGSRTEMLEIVVNPLLLQAAKLPLETVYSAVSRNNQLVAAGSLSNDNSRTAIKVPGVIDDIETLLNLVLKADGDKVLLLRDIAEVRRSYIEADKLNRLNGQPAVQIAITRRSGANTVEVLNGIRELIAPLEAQLPEEVEVSWVYDESVEVARSLKSLMNSILSGVILVMIVVIGVLGIRSGLLVGLSIPGSFVLGILALYLLGITLNQVVLFGLMLSLGLLVDGAIVVVELADKNLNMGMGRRQAYAEAAKHMAWPVFSSTATTLGAFLPLLFWPGMMGHFMSKLPMAVICVLCASLLLALIFVPNVGALTGPRKPRIAEEEEQQGPSLYARLLRKLVQYPVWVLVGTIIGLVGVVKAYGVYGAGVEFFPDTPPPEIYFNIQARGDMSITERDRLVRQVEEKLLPYHGQVKSVLTTVGMSFDNQPEDVIGQVTMTLHPWPSGRPWKELKAEFDELLIELNRGVVVQLHKRDDGPAEGKPVVFEVSSLETEPRSEAIDIIRSAMEKVGGFIAIEDSRPLLGLEWRLNVDRARATSMGADIVSIGQAVQLVTQGVKIGEYRPDDVDEELDIRVRYPQEFRTLASLDQLQITTAQGQVPMSSFVERVPVQKVDTIRRIDGERVYTIDADVKDGLLADTQLQKLAAVLADAEFAEGVHVRVRGESEQQRESAEFLGKALLAALALITMVLVIQFNSFYQAGVILTAVVFSVVGALITMLITGRPFGVIMGGMGIISLAGIVVNNNIVLIDTYNHLRAVGLSAVDAVVETGSQRLRPVILTTVTTGLGLLPMALQASIDITDRVITIGSPDGMWWVQLSTVLIGGLIFATLLTLLVTPCLLVIGGRFEKTLSEQDKADLDASVGMEGH